MALNGAGGSAIASIPLDLSAYSAVSVSGWILPRSYPGSFSVIWEFTSSGGGAAGGFSLFQNAGAPKLQFLHSDSGALNAQDAANASTGSWVHFTVTHDFAQAAASEIKVWRNGVPDTLTPNGIGECSSASKFANSTLYLMSRAGSSIPVDGVLSDFMVLSGAVTDATAKSLYENSRQIFEPLNDDVFYSMGGATDYPVTATDALTLGDSASQLFAATGVAAEAMTLADSASNVAALGAAGSAALTLADSATNVAALSATATDALTLADTLNGTASGDYTATGSDALTLADSATNVAALGATGTDALTLADAASNTAALGATAADALTLADTLNASASGDYVVTATDALSLSDSVVAAYAAICIATDALTLADATSAAMAGEYAATATDALTLADAVSNAAALGVSISEALTLAELVSALNSGQLVLGVRGRPGVQIQTGTRRAQIQTGRRRN